MIIHLFIHSKIKTMWKQINDQITNKVKRRYICLSVYLIYRIHDFLFSSSLFIRRFLLLLFLSHTFVTFVFLVHYVICLFTLLIYCSAREFSLLIQLIHRFVACCDFVAEEHYSLLIPLYYAHVFAFLFRDANKLRKYCIDLV